MGQHGINNEEFRLRLAQKLDGVQDAKVNFMLQKFTLEAADEQFDAILQQAIEVGKKIEPDFAVEL